MFSKKKQQDQQPHSKRSSQPVNIKITGQKNGDLIKSSKPKKGVTRHLTHILKPINSEQGGKAIGKTLFTSNGFNKKKFDHDCFELQNQ